MTVCERVAAEERKRGIKLRLMSVLYTLNGRCFSRFVPMRYPRMEASPF